MASAGGRGVRKGWSRDMSEEPTRSFEVRWDDIDLNGRPRNTRYLEYAATARLGFLTGFGRGSREPAKAGVAAVSPGEEVRCPCEVFPLARVVVGSRVVGLGEEGGTVAVRTPLRSGERGGSGRRAHPGGVDRPPCPQDRPAAVRPAGRGVLRAGGRLRSDHVDVTKGFRGTGVGGAAAPTSGKNVGTAAPFLRPGQPMNTPATGVLLWMNGLASGAGSRIGRRNCARSVSLPSLVPAAGCPAPGRRALLDPRGERSTG